VPRSREAPLEGRTTSSRTATSCTQTPRRYRSELSSASGVPKTRGPVFRPLTQRCLQTLGYGQASTQWRAARTKTFGTGRDKPLGSSEHELVRRGVALQPNRNGEKTAAIDVIEAAEMTFCALPDRICRDVARPWPDTRAVRRQWRALTIVGPLSDYLRTDTSWGKCFEKVRRLEPEIRVTFWLSGLLDSSRNPRTPPTWRTDIRARTATRRTRHCPHDVVRQPASPHSRPRSARPVLCSPSHAAHTSGTRATFTTPHCGTHVELEFPLSDRTRPRRLHYHRGSA
jgi:hypothetical protein